MDHDKAKRFIGPIRDFLVAFALFCCLFGLILQPNVVNGNSMCDTLHDEDFRLGLRLNVEGRIKRGDIAVIRTDLFPGTKHIIKRVIGLPGETVAIDYEQGTVSVNGVLLSEPYIRERMVPPDGMLQASYTVPAGAVFVMGDNRNHSYDSRMPDLGMVSIGDIDSLLIG